MPSRLNLFMLEEYKQQFEGAEYFFFTGYHGITAAQTVQIRSRIREAGQKMKVVKNSIAKIAFEELEIGQAAELLNDDTLVYFGDNPVSIAKAIVDLSKEIPALKFNGAYMTGQILGPEDAKAVALMPTLPELQSMIAGTVMAPGRNLASALNGCAQNIVYALKSLEEKLQG